MDKPCKDTTLYRDVEHRSRCLHSYITSHLLSKGFSSSSGSARITSGMWLQTTTSDEDWDLGYSMIVCDWRQVRLYYLTVLLMQRDSPKDNWSLRQCHPHVVAICGTEIICVNAALSRWVLYMVGRNHLRISLCHWQSSNHCLLRIAPDEVEPGFGRWHQETKEIPIENS